MKLTPSNFRQYTVFVLILVGLGLVVMFILRTAVDYLGVYLPWWIETPSAIGVAGALYALFDKCAWSWSFFHWCGLVDAPDLRGRWIGELLSSYDDEQMVPKRAVVEIKQSASEILINLYTEHSQSSSTVASFSKSPDGHLILCYNYLNEPIVLAPGTMEIHFGSADLRYFPDIRQLRGEYYTSRERQTHGSMTFQFEGRKLLGRFE